MFSPKSSPTLHWKRNVLTNHVQLGHRKPFPKALSTLATIVAEFGSPKTATICCRVRRQSPKSAGDYSRQCGQGLMAYVKLSCDTFRRQLLGLYAFIPSLFSIHIRWSPRICVPLKVHNPPLSRVFRNFTTKLKV